VSFLDDCDELERARAMLSDISDKVYRKDINTRSQIQCRLENLRRFSLVSAPKVRDTHRLLCSDCEYGYEHEGLEEN
jgi:hypothetical protein